MAYAKDFAPIFVRASEGLGFGHTLVLFGVVIYNMLRPLILLGSAAVVGTWYGSAVMYHSMMNFHLGYLMMTLIGIFLILILLWRSLPQPVTPPRE